MAAHHSFYNRYMLTRNRHVRSVKAGRHGLRRKPAQTSVCSFGWAMATHQGPARWSPPLSGDAARSRPSASVARGGWQEIPQRAPRLGSTPPWRGIAGAAIINMRQTAVQKYSWVLPLNHQLRVSPREPQGPPKGRAQGRGSQGSTTEQHCRVRGPSRGCVPSRTRLQRGSCCGVPIVALSARA